MRLAPTGYFHLLFFGVFLPYLAIRTSKRVSTRPLPPKVPHFRAQVATLLVFLALSLAVAFKEWIILWPREFPDARMILIGLLVLVVMIMLMRPMWRSRVEARARKIWLFMPRTGEERAWWVACSVAAGISEEVTYRGVMYALLWRLTDSMLAAALIGATIFAVSHFMQGIKSMAIIFAFALTFQGIAFFTGSLYVGIAVHALYDVAAGLFYGYYGERLGYPIEPMPA
jgi:membrane protease YdiL (CAAX protease family)